MPVGDNPFEQLRRKMITARIEFMGHLATLSKETIERSAISGGRSPLQIIHHLYINDGLALEHMRRVQCEENPLIEQNVAFDAASPPLEILLAEMVIRRVEIFALLSNLSCDDWQRPFHQKDGVTLTFEQMIQQMPVYDQQHTVQLIAIKETLNTIQ